MATVALDANATVNGSASGVTTVDLTTLTVGVGTSRALVAQLSWGGGTVSGVTVNWDQTGTPQACTLIKNLSPDTNTQAYLYGLVAPTSGNKTLRATWTGTADVIINATAVTGADPTGGTTTFPNSISATATNASPSVTITSAVGNMTMDCVSTLASQTISTPTKTQTFDAFNGSAQGAGSRAAGAASNVHGWTLTGSQLWASVGTDIQAFNHPQITVQPQQTQVISGATANFTITAMTSGGTLHYQWKLNGVNAGTDSTSYTTAATTNADNLDTIQCVVTDDNGSTNSNTVYLLVVPTASEWLYTA